MAERRRSRLGSIGHRLYTGEISYDFVGRRRIWYTLSAILIAIALISLAVFRLNFGIEFKGGAEFQAPTHVTSQTVPGVRTAIKATGLPGLNEATINTIGSNTVRVQTRTLSVPEVTTIRGAIAKAGVSSNQVAYSLVGASWGSQITSKAILALIVFLVLVGLVIWAYFRNGTMSLAALVALAHDLILTVGVYALVRFTVTPATLIGVLTILGYSLYDTVVVFDKVRENVRDLKSSTTRTYSEAANLATNQVLVRSINTTIIGVLPVAALLFAGAFILGEGPLKDLALALFVGMISGAYSSVFLATPLLAQLKERDPEMVTLRRRVEARRAREAVKGGRRPAAVALDVADAGTEPAIRPVGRRGGATAIGARPGGLGPPVEADALEQEPVEDIDGIDEGATERGPRRAASVPVSVSPAGPADRRLPNGAAVPRPRSGADLRPRSEAAAGRPQPQRRPRSQRRK